MSALAVPLSYFIAFMPYYTYNYYWDDREISVSEVQHIIAVFCPVFVSFLLVIWKSDIDLKIRFLTVLIFILILAYYLFMLGHSLLIEAMFSNAQDIMHYAINTGSHVVLGFKLFLCILPFILLRFTKKHFQKIS